MSGITYDNPTPAGVRALVRPIPTVTSAPLRIGLYALSIRCWMREWLQTVQTKIVKMLKKRNKKLLTSAPLFVIFI
jgi:hypothetical protein